MKQRTFDFLWTLITRDITSVIFATFLTYVCGFVIFAIGVIYYHIIIGASPPLNFAMIFLLPLPFMGVASFIAICYRLSKRYYNITKWRHFWVIFSTPVYVAREEFDEILQFAYDNCKGLFAPEHRESWQSSLPSRRIFFLTTSDAVLVQLRVDQYIRPDNGSTEPIGSKIDHIARLRKKYGLV